MKQFYVYILASRSKTIYVGFTNDLKRRVYEHKKKITKGFTKRYNITRLVYFELFDAPEEAIAREKQLKGWLRKKKVALIESMNPDWEDLSEEWE